MPAKKHRDQIIDAALKGGAIGATLGAVLTGKSKHTVVATLLGAAIGASIQAMNEAKENNLSVIVEEANVLYKLNPDGSRQPIQKLKRSNRKIPSSFTID